MKGLTGIVTALLIISVLHRFGPNEVHLPNRSHQLLGQVQNHNNNQWHDPNSLEAILSLQNRSTKVAILRGTKSQKHCLSLTTLVLLLSGNVELNPGPTSIYPCGLCQVPVTWTCKGICCDSCNVWFHHNCADVASAEYQSLSNPATNIAWICPRCDSINCGSFTYKSYELECTNHYSVLENSDIQSITSNSSFRPLLTSSPQSNKQINKSCSNTSNSYNPNNESQLDPSSLLCSPPNAENIRIMNINCQGLRSKTQEFAAVIQYTKPDIVCVTESWLSGIAPGKTPEPDAIKSSEIIPDGYTAYRNDRNANGGGVLILVKKTIASSEEPTFTTDCEILWANIKLQNHKQLLVGAFYSPHRKLKDFNELKKSLEILTKEGKQMKDIILAGDFNCPDIDWENHQLKQTITDKHAHQALLNTTNDFHLTQVHHTPTRGKNILDLIFTSSPSLVKSSTTIPGLSDHDIIISDFDIRPHRMKQKPRLCYKYNQANWENIEKDMKKTTKIIQDENRQGQSPNHLWLTFKNNLTTSMTNNIKSVMVKDSNTLPWLSTSLQKLLKRKKRLFKKAKATNKWTDYRIFQKHCKKEMRRAEWRHLNEKIEEGLQNKNTKPFWRYIKAKNKDNIGVAPLMEDGKLHSDSQSKANILLKQFQSVFTTTKKNTIPRLNQHRNQITPIKISVEGVTKLLSNLKPNKASGPDNIPNRVLKTLATSIAPILTIIFQSSLDSGQIPDDWLSANIACAYKKGDRRTPSNYRPISLTSVSCKILEHILYRHIMNHLESENILTTLNHGFRSGFSTETQLLTTTNDLLLSYDQGRQVDMAILDFSKAFDTVPHDLLLHKLKNYGITGNIHAWLECFLTQRTMRVIVEGTTSKDAPVASGVPQGTVLGPLLFLCHINDLPEVVNSQVRLFADDCLVYREIRKPKDHTTLQDDLNSLESWANKWGMRFNASKCYIISVAKSPSSSHFYSLNKTILQQVPSNPYLGIKFTAQLDWSEHIGTITKKANSTLGFLRRNLKHCPESCRKNAYLALVRPILEYASIIWDPHTQREIKMLEKVQRRAVRFIAGDYKTRTPGTVTNLLKAHDLLPLQERRSQQRLTYFYKMTRGQIPALPPENFVQALRPARLIRPKRNKDYITTNPIQRYTRNNDTCYQVPKSNTQQYQHSFFPQTIADWNQLADNVVHQPTVDSFKSALARARAQ